MRIEITKSNSSLIAVDDADGEFWIQSDEHVSYVGPDGSEWYVNANKMLFLQSLNCYKKYVKSVLAQSDESEQLKCVQEFIDKLLNIEKYTGVADSYWQSIVAQVEQGSI